jgi:hypothetical protein
MNVRLGYSLRLTAGIWWDSRLIMNNYDVTFKMLTVSSDHANQNIALDRLRYMADQCFTDAVFICETEQEQIKKLHAAGIKTAVLPEEPVDQIIGMVLFAKMNAVMEGQILIRSVLLSSTAGDSIIYEHDHSEEIAPFDQLGWWLDPDPVHEFRSTDLESDSVLVIPDNTVWRDVGLEWNNDLVESDAGNILVFTEFKNDKDK